jgi:hypothetical protein
MNDSIEDKRRYGDNPEIVMDAFRMARSGHYRTARQLRVELERQYPECTRQQISDALSKLASLIEKQNER